MDYDDQDLIVLSFFQRHWASSVSMNDDNFSAINARKQELLEARILGNRVRRAKVRYKITIYSIIVLSSYKLLVVTERGAVDVDL